MTATTEILFAGWALYFLGAMGFQYWRWVADHRAGRPVRPRVYLLQRVLVFAGCVPWLALVLLSMQTSVVNLAFVFLVCIIPMMAVFLVSQYVTDLRLYKTMLGQEQRQGRRGD